VLSEVESIVFEQQRRFEEDYRRLIEELATHNIVLLDENKLSAEQEKFVRNYFQQVVRPSLFPVMLDGFDQNQSPAFDDHSIYLAVRMSRNNGGKPKHCLIEVPADKISRFLVLPRENGNEYIILLDDVIRVGLRAIFSPFDFTEFEAYTIKLTRDAELDIQDDLTLSFLEKISKSLKKRDRGTQVRFVYDAAMPPSMLRLLMKKKLVSSSDTLIPGGKYHNFKDFIAFPSAGSPDLRYERHVPVPHPELKSEKSMLALIRRKDIMLQYPYQSFNHFIDLLREASIDPSVTSIKVSLYRLAKNSNVVNALINAVRNGKDVTVVMELQARFDEQANIYWTDVLREEGVRILYGVPELKIHAKLTLITRREGNRERLYCNVSTGNYNEATARLYTDHSFFTADERITKEVFKIFDFMEHPYKPGKYKHLLVSPFQMRESMMALIANEAENARQGKRAEITIKINHISDREIADALYAASQAGVKINMIVRGVCSLLPGVKNLSENIHGVSIVDKFLEHSRLILFHNGGDERLYLTSADWMNRNLDRRVEVAVPIYSPRLRREIKKLLELQLSDNTKARQLSATMENDYHHTPGKKVRAQTDWYQYIADKSNGGARKSASAGPRKKTE
jgi:polyphosphate kinase